MSTQQTTVYSWQIAEAISPAREQELLTCLKITPNIAMSVYAFSGQKLTRADVEWLLSHHDGGRGPIDWSDPEQRSRQGLDLRGADLSGADLHDLPLARLVGSLSETGVRVTTEQGKAAAIRLDGANCRGTHLEGGILFNVSAIGAQFQGAFLQLAILRWGNLAGAHFREADLTEADLSKTRLEGANLRKTRVERLNLGRAVLNAETNIDAYWEKAGVRCLDVSWGGAILTRISWMHVTLGEDWIARKERTGEAYIHASRTNRQLALQLQSQGLAEEAMLFNYRAQKFQRLAWRKQRKYGKYLFSAALNLSCGYGYRPLRSLVLYMIVVGSFALLFALIGHLSWYEALIDSIVSLHGRGFFASSFAPGNPLAIAAAIEAILGLLVEVVVLATVSRRIFSN